MYWAPRPVKSLWDTESIFITENGCAAADEIAEDGNIYDTDRVMFLRAYLTQLQRATSEGMPVDGYFLWSAQDNFEWIWGYGDRFGIVYVDFETLERTPRAQRRLVPPNRGTERRGVAPNEHEPSHATACSACGLLISCGGT